MSATSVAAKSARRLKVVKAAPPTQEPISSTLADVTSDLRENAYLVYLQLRRLRDKLDVMIPEQSDDESDTDFMGRLEDHAQATRLLHSAMHWMEYWPEGHQYRHDVPRNLALAIASDAHRWSRATIAAVKTLDMARPRSVEKWIEILKDFQSAISSALGPQLDADLKELSQ